MLPHGSFLAADRYKHRFPYMQFDEAKAGLYGMIEDIDDKAGRLTAYLDDWNLLQDTVMIVMSDNGMTRFGSGLVEQQIGVMPDGAPVHRSMPV